MAKWKERYLCLGLSEAEITAVVEEATLTIRVIKQFKDTIIRVRNGFKGLFKWLISVVRCMFHASIGQK